ncbi:MAG: CPBP family intramembrane metalloprotease [Ruminiclostridium sp.]|nr:CPBP family intramembrane metalloprotease [Ruminiclostridium sp.]
MKQERKELLIFLAVTYGLTFLMGIPMAIFAQQGRELISFAYAQMLYPAAGLMLARLICRRDDPSLPKPFFLGFLALTALTIATCFLPMGFTYLAYLTYISSITLGVILFASKDDSLRPHNLSGENWGISLRIILLFVGILLADIILRSALSTELSDTIQNLLTSNLLKLLLILPLLFLLTFPHYFGEEYGWRTYFQPLLQNKFGLIKGVFLFGILWEFWHFPLVIFYYAPLSSSMSLLQLILYRYVMVILIAIFMAYAYMKTQNVWLPAFLHCVNNILAELGPENGNCELTWAMLGLFILIRLVLFLPFLRSKVFRPQPHT